MNIENREYILSHGRAPKGRGHWGFLLYSTKSTEPEIIFAPGYRTLTQAKSWLKKEVGLKGVINIQVAP